MAPTLRKAKPRTELAEPVLRSILKSDKKRKVADDASPVSVKKQKALKEPQSKSKAKANPPAKKSEAKQKQPEPEARQEQQEPEETAKVPRPGSRRPVDDEEDEADKDVKALVASFDDSDSDDLSDRSADGPALQPIQDVGKIPETSAKDKKQQKRKHGEDGSPEKPGVIYVGRIPHGFYEHQMREYFGQFGAITRLRLSRNRRTGASKHYAFVEFAEASTAEIVARTMDNYLLFGHILRCRVLAPDQVHERLWDGANRRFKKVPWARIHGRRLEEPKSESAWEAHAGREREKRTRRTEKLKAIGYEYDAPALKTAVARVEPSAVAENGEPQDLVEAAPAREKLDEGQVEAIEGVAARVEKALDMISDPVSEAGGEAPVRVSKKAKAKKGSKGGKK